MNIKKIAAVSAVAALAGPGVALAHDTSDPNHKHGKSEQAKSKQKGVGFVVAGEYVSGLTLNQSGENLGAFTLDITSANKHARSFLGPWTDKPSKEDPEQDTITPATGDDAVIKFVGFETGDSLGTDDRVKVIGKVTRVRKGDATTTRVLDIRRITIKDVE